MVLGGKGRQVGRGDCDGLSLLGARGLDVLLQLVAINLAHDLSDTESALDARVLDCLAQVRDAASRGGADVGSSRVRLRDDLVVFGRARLEDRFDGCHDLTAGLELRIVCRCIEPGGISMEARIGQNTRTALWTGKQRATCRQRRSLWRRGPEGQRMVIDAWLLC